MPRQFGWIALLLIVVTVAACRTANPAPSPETEEPTVELEAGGDGVFVVQDGQRTALNPEEPVSLAIGQGVVIEETGSATIRLGGLLTAELLPGSELELAEVAAADEATTLTLQQSSGILLADFNPGGQSNRELTLETGLAAVTTRGASFLVVYEPAASLEWVVNLGEPEETLQVRAGGQTRPVAGDEARWLAPGQVPGEALEIEPKRLQAWYNSAKSGEAELALSEVLLAPANLVGTPATLPALPRLGQPFELGRTEQGAVKLTLDPVGLFGRPAYSLEDCNGDGLEEIAIQSGQLRFDFRSVLARALALDVTVVNRAAPGQGALWGSDPAGDELDRVLVETGAGRTETLSLRSERPFHTTILALSDGCFTGFSLTPPSTAGRPLEPRAAATTQPEDAVVNILEPARSPSLAAPLEARPAGAGDLQIDGDVADWDDFLGSSGWIAFEAITFDQGCNNRYPDSATGTDLTAQVGFAYDEQNLYVAFRVEDDGLVSYTGAGENFFMGDSPQLSLDMDLQGDYSETNRNQDDWQIDFLPDAAAPRVALWQLGSLSSRLFEEARVAISLTPGGYLLEAALPWPSFGTSLQPGQRLGVAANVNDNDTPGTNSQECIISTAPERQWDDPTTWGTLLLVPPP